MDRLSTRTVVAGETAGAVAVVGAGGGRGVGSLAGAGVHVADLSSSTLLVAGAGGDAGACVAELILGALGVTAALDAGVGVAVAEVVADVACLAAGAHYFAFYNELFLNLNQDIGQGRRVDTFDRNRLYLGYGYSLRDDLRLQFGYMNQRTDDIDKGQLQFSVFHTM